MLARLSDYCILTLDRLHKRESLLASYGISADVAPSDRPVYFRVQAPLVLPLPQLTRTQVGTSVFAEARPSPCKSLHIFDKEIVKVVLWSGHFYCLVVA